MKIAEMVNSEWMLLPDVLKEVIGIYEAHWRGPKIDIAGIESRLGFSIVNDDDDEIKISNGVAIVPITGVLINKGTMLTRFFGMTSMQEIGETLKLLANNDAVHTIILDIDSGGGTVSGTTELADLVHSISKSKKVVALANDLMASSALFIGSAANEVHISSDLARVGSIGIATVHTEYSKANEAAGIQITEIYTGKYKRMVTGSKPLSKEGKEYIQSSLEKMHTVFVERVAKYRGLPVEKIFNTEAKVFIGNEGIEAGLVDGVSTLDELIKKLSATDGVPGMDSNISANYKEGDQDMANAKEGISPVKHENVKHNTIVVDDVNAISESYAKGVKAETVRIKGIEAHSMPGHEDLITEMKFDGKTTPDQAAVKILTAEKANLASKAADIKEDGTKVVAQTVSAETPTVDLKSLPIEERCKKEWESDPKVKAEFSSLETYEAYQKADSEGKVNLKTNAQ